MDVIGLGGAPGSGKSTVARALAARSGIEWIELDRVAWTTYRIGTPTHRRLVEWFGKRILTTAGEIDRQALAREAFARPAARRALDGIVHPAVTAALREEIARHRAAGTSLLLVEGALLGVSEAVDYSLFDALLWLDAPDAVRRRRLTSEGRAEHGRRWEARRFAVPVTRIRTDRPLDATVEAIRSVIATAQPPTSG
jgi:dephospho-CoA kinase